MSKPIVFFDGICSVCNHFVDFLLKKGPNIFLFSSLQGETARKELDPAYVQNGFKTIVLLEGGQVYTQSQAVLRVFSKLPWPWKLLSFFQVLPLRFLNLGYDFFSLHRYQWFGKKDTCRIPTPEERAQFLE